MYNGLQQAIFRCKLRRLVGAGYEGQTDDVTSPMRCWATVDRLSETVRCLSGCHHWLPSGMPAWRPARTRSSSGQAPPSVTQGIDKRRWLTGN